MWPLAMLMGNCINEGFYKKMCGCFARSKKVAVMTKWLYYQGGRWTGFLVVSDILNLPV